MQHPQLMLDLMLSGMVHWRLLQTAGAVAWLLLYQRCRGWVGLKQHVPMCYIGVALWQSLYTVMSGA
jgi:hypothetical protein